MNILIAYATKSGTTARCAELLASHFPHHETRLVDLVAEHPDPTNYDMILVGAPIRYGKLAKKALSFLTEQAAAIEALPHAFFICRASEESGETPEEYLRLMLPAPLLDAAIALESFGGELNVARQKGLDKLITRMMRRAILASEESEDPEERRYLPSILPETIGRFADKVKRSFK